MVKPLMARATAVWLVDNTTLSFKQIGDFVSMHELEIQGIADGDVALGVKGFDPVANNQLDLDEIKNEKIMNLSNSQKQKVVIARALINNPNIIIADQPETFLDEVSKRKIFYLLESLSKLGSTIIITSSKDLYIKSSHKILELN